MMENHPFRFLLARMASAGVFFGVVILVNALQPGQLSPMLVAVVTASYLLLNLVFYAVGFRQQYLLLLLIDSVFVTLLIYLTGGPESRFPFLYLVLIVFGGFYLERNALHFLAAFSVVLLTGTLFLQYASYIPTFSRKLITAGDLSYVVGVNFVAMLVVSLATGMISYRVRRLTGRVEVQDRKLRALTRLKNRIVDAIPSALVTTDARGRITFLNHGVREFLRRHEGPDPDALIGRDLNDWIPVREMWDESDPDVVQRMEYTFENGAIIGMNLTRMYSDNEFVGILMIFQDLTDMKAMERSMWFRNSLMSLGEMAAGIAHEIRNPLASISGAVQLLKENDTTGANSELFGIIEDELLRLRESIQDFLSFAKGDEDVPDRQNVNGLLAEVIALFEKGKPEDVLLHVDPDIYRCRYDVLCKRGKFKRVIWNLLKNAEKAVQYRDVKEIRVSVQRDSDNVRVVVRDTGPGVPESERQRIFEPYYSTFAKGFGLGLALSRTMVEEMGGRIEVGGIPGEGAEFVVIIPALAVESEKGSDHG